MDFRLTICDVHKPRRLIVSLLLMIVSLVMSSFSQVENVPVNNQVYEYLSRMGVRGLLPLYSNAMIPLSRQEVAGMIQSLGD